MKIKGLHPLSKFFLLLFLSITRSLSHSLSLFLFPIDDAPFIYQHHHHHVIHMCRRNKGPAVYEWLKRKTGCCSALVCALISWCGVLSANKGTSDKSSFYRHLALIYLRLATISTRGHNGNQDLPGRNIDYQRIIEIRLPHSHRTLVVLLLLFVPSSSSTSSSLYHHHQHKHRAFYPASGQATQLVCRSELLCSASHVLISACWGLPVLPLQIHLSWLHSYTAKNDEKVVFGQVGTSLHSLSQQHHHHHYLGRRALSLSLAPSSLFSVFFVFSWPGRRSRLFRGPISLHLDGFL